VPESWRFERHPSNSSRLEDHQMKTRFAGGAFIALTMVTTVGHAADMPLRPPPMMAPAPLYNWTACYLGTNSGLGAGHTQWTDTQPDGNIDMIPGLARTANLDMSGAAVGGQIGCDYQFGGNWVVGIAASFDGADISGNAFDEFNTTWALQSKLNWFGTVTGRVGYAVNNVLLYAKGGVVFANDHYEIANTAVVLGDPNPVLTGWTFGAGLEWAFAPCWSVFVETNYYGFSATTQTFDLAPGFIDAPPTINVKPSFETVMLGINYRLGSN
jgi:outer membrane immunogenic protein